MSGTLAPKSIRILLVDDHQIMREGLRMTLNQVADFEVAGEAGDAKNALHQAGHLHPDVAVVDIGLPDCDGVDLARELLQRFSRLKVVVLSAVADQEHLDGAMEVGVSGYLLKTNASEELVRAIRAARRNETYLSPEVSSVLLTGYKRLRESRRVENASDLSEREREVLKLIADGRNTKEIAAQLSLSVKTVETHRTRIMDKLNLHSVAELTKYAIRLGYTTC